MGEPLKIIFRVYVPEACIVCGGPWKAEDGAGFMGLPLTTDKTGIQLTVLPRAHLN